MTTFEDMLKKRPIDPEILEEKVRKMEEEARAFQETQEALYADMAEEYNEEERALRAGRRRRLSPFSLEE